MMKKILLKSFGFLILSIFILALLFQNGFINVSLLLNVLKEHFMFIYLISFFQISNTFFLCLRYASLLEVFGVKAEFKKVVSSTFISNGLGQWLPGAMAFIEVIRVSLMMGSQKETKMEQIEHNMKLSSRLVAVSLYDRLIGLFVMLFLGVLTSLGIMCFQFFFLIQRKNLNSILFLFFFSLFSCVFLFFLPKMCHSPTVRKMLIRFEKFSLSIFKKGLFHKIFRKVFHEMNSLIEVIHHFNPKGSALWKPLVHSVFCVFSFTFGTYCSALALQGSISFWAILSTTSLVSLSSLLPLNFGGMGVAQVIGMAALSLFHVQQQLAASSQLLQSSVNLFIITVLAIFFIGWTKQKTAPWGAKKG